MCDPYENPSRLTATASFSRRGRTTGMGSIDTHHSVVRHSGYAELMTLISPIDRDFDMKKLP